MAGVLCFTVVGLPDGDVHHVQGPHWEKRVPCGLDGHEHGSEQVSSPYLQRAWHLSTQVTPHRERQELGRVSPW